MGSLFGDWPSFDPHNFSQLRPSDPSSPSVSISFILLNQTQFDIKFHSQGKLSTLYDFCSFLIYPLVFFFLGTELNGNL